MDQSVMVSIGYGGFVSAKRVISIVDLDSAPIRRVVSDARDYGRLIDATYGRRTKAVIIADSGYVVLSGLQPETISNRFKRSENGSQG